MSEFRNSIAGSEEEDSRFPSGPWTGFFLQPAFPGKHWMDLEIQFRSGKLTGAGGDWVGRFTLSGTYDIEGGRCLILKSYLAQHHVSYEGFNEGKGIWGRWTIPAVATGGFHIWPKAWGQDHPTRDRAVIETPSEVTEVIALS